MAGKAFLTQVDGGLVEDRALQSSLGAADAGKIPALDAARSAGIRLANAEHRPDARAGGLQLHRA